MAELRLDYLAGDVTEAGLAALLEGRACPVIVTYRPDWEGGQYGGDEDTRLAMLVEAVRLGAEYIDIELLAAERLAPLLEAAGGRGQTKVIVSNHDYGKTPADDVLMDKLQAMVAAGADIAKLACMSAADGDAARMLALPHRMQQEAGSDVPVIALCMGESGLSSRVLAAKCGGYLTFGALEAGKVSAPGQPSIASLIDTFRAKRMGADTRVYGLLGNPVAQSKGAQLHNAAYEATGVDAVYVPFLCDSPADFLESVEADASFAGFSVTIPHKQAAMECCAELDPLAERIGAVNTLVRRADGTFKGYNTDSSAAVGAIEVALGGAADVLEGRPMVVIGAGGAGRALAAGAMAKGARVVIVNRTQDKAEMLAASLGDGAEAAPMEVLASGELLRSLGAGAVLANTTSVGMVPDVDATPVPREALAGAGVAAAFDAGYNPMKTRLLQDAEAEGAVAVSGVEMFVGQAAEQFLLFTGEEPPVELMRKVVVDALQ